MISFPSLLYTSLSRKLPVFPATMGFSLDQPACGKEIIYLMDSAIFPEYNPQYKARYAMSELIQGYYNDDKRRRAYWALRHSSSGFISKADVRSFIFNRDGYKCVLCGSVDKLSIDHINSVHSAVYGNFNPYLLNTEQNLRTLCVSCNSKT